MQTSKVTYNIRDQELLNDTFFPMINNSISFLFPKERNEPNVAAIHFFWAIWFLNTSHSECLKLILRDFLIMVLTVFERSRKMLSTSDRSQMVLCAVGLTSLFHMSMFTFNFWLANSLLVSCGKISSTFILSRVLPGFLPWSHITISGKKCW